MSVKKMLPILIEHQKKYPGFSAQDAYKLIYQRYLGPSHLMIGVIEAREAFFNEFKSVKSDNSFELAESISPDNSILRIHLAPYKSTGADPEKLFEAFLASLKNSKIDLAEFINTWNRLILLTQNGKTDFDADDIEKVDSRARKSEYPPMKHSEAYKKLNNPHYRLIYRDILGDRMPDLKIRL